MDQVTVPRATVQQALGALEGGGDSWRLIGPAIEALRAALEQPEPCQYPDCVDNGPEGKCTRWLLAECSKSEDYKPHRPAEPERAQKMRDAGYTRRPTLREMAEPLYEKPPTTWTSATTPPDTERTVLAWVNGEWFSAWYYARDRQWMDACMGATIENVTHWMDPTPHTTTTQPEPK
jgi:hypothetical protein